MCDKPHFDELEHRVDDVESRLGVVETSLAALRDETQRGFADIKTTLNELFGERAKWGEFARLQLERIIRWLMWLIPALAGLYTAGDWLAKYNH